MNYIFHTDPGHGWLEVSRDELKRLGIAEKVSTYSYQQGNKVFLEEDCDASLFFRVKEQMGEPVKYSHLYNENTPIMDYASYRI